MITVGIVLFSFIIKKLGKFTAQLINWKSNYIVITTFDSLDKHGSSTLDSISTSFVSSKSITYC
uniref:Uncharacterized protein n=1 Tax=Ciona intestinalis TaxID=7719 RepID=F6QIA0_CIOIN